MKCFNEMTYAEFLDEELDRKTQAMVKAHLEECQACRIMVERLTDENSLLRDTFAIEMPHLNLAEEISLRIKPVEIPRAVNGKLLTPLLYCTLFVLAFFFPFFILSHYAPFIEKARQVLSFFITPLTVFFDTLSVAKTLYLRGHIADLSRTFLLLSLLMITILYGMNAVLKGNHLLSTQKGDIQ